MNINEIKQMPTVYENIHESVFRRYHILNLVEAMLKRGDSKETIIELIRHIETGE